ncbi:ribonuclease toxin immunity protein CdiI [Acinetobacter sp. I-MWF]|uniref:ribonuclease toxin immunity protein CdiI n=1 Tax=Acinetobacter TaxID=469 RepID=UPI0021C581A8|nr:ribonuclease toxin immunity protein CdiI [Acinetobacter sp. I-MWF]MCT9978150.1 ribonuclease toxin immunity protein CdiI [Acinetobacter sp. I-MWF]
MKHLFDLPYDHFNTEGTVKSYFDLMYNEGRFLDAIENIIDRESYMLDGIYCFFPDMNSSEEEEHFEGVQFAIGYPPSSENTVTVSEEICCKFVRLACEKFLNLHPECTNDVNVILKKWSSTK